MSRWTPTIFRKINDTAGWDEESLAAPDAHPSLAQHPDVVTSTHLYAVGMQVIDKAIESDTPQTIIFNGVSRVSASAGF